MWRITKDGAYSVRSSLDLLEGGKRDFHFPKEADIFCVGALVGQDYDTGPNLKNRIFSC